MLFSNPNESRLSKAVDTILKFIYPGIILILFVLFVIRNELTPLSVAVFLFNGVFILVINILFSKCKKILLRQRGDYELASFILDLTPLSIEVWRDCGELIYCNKKTLEFAKVGSFENFKNDYETNIEYSQNVQKFISQTLDEGYHRIEREFQQSDEKTTPLDTHFHKAKIENSNIVLGFSIDMTEVNQSIERERELNEYNELLISSAPYVVNIWDDSQSIASTTFQCALMFGLTSRHEFIKRFYELSPETQPCGSNSTELMDENIRTAFDSGYRRFEWMHQKLNGDPMPHEITLVRFKRQGRSFLFAYYVDLRPLKALLAREQKEERLRQIAEEESRAKTRFLARMSHEVRTPMNAVLGITDIQLQKEHPMETEDAFLRIHHASKLLLAIINDILDLSKVEAGKMVILPEKYETASLIVDTVQMNLIYIGEKELEFTLRVDQNLPLTMYGDQSRIKQVLNNVISNALKYTPRGTVELALSAIEQENPNDIIFVIEVTDTGIGMTDEEVAQMFEIEFTRHNVFENRSIEGSGLGMSITKAIVGLMNGQIEVTSKPGVGTKFKITIPQKNHTGEKIGFELAQKLQDIEETKNLIRKVEKKTIEAMPHGRILVVDDVETNLFVVEGLLMPYQLEVNTAESGQEAIDLVKSGEEYDIIFMDHMMPGVDGLEATIRIRESGYTKPIVALTANVTEGTSNLFLSNGFDGFVSKPIDPDKMNEVLIKYVKCP